MTPDLDDLLQALLAHDPDAPDVQAPLDALRWLSAALKPLSDRKSVV